MQKLHLNYIVKPYSNVLVYYRSSDVASGYNLSTKHPYQLQKARLGIYEKQPFAEKSLTGINEMALRLRSAGGYSQQERMIHDKREALNRALHFSYQAAKVRKVDPENGLAVRALINPNKLKQDYDDKILSVGYECNFNPGDVFEWLGTGTHWLIYLQDLTELAYFRGDIRKCNYSIQWNDEDGNLQKTWIAVRGPVETKINFIQKSGISLDTPNHSLNILMPKTEETIKRFTRYSKFYLTGADDITSSTCWRVEATDTISMPGILEINAIEYYANETKDDISAGIIDGLVVNPEVPGQNEFMIYGETFIKPKKIYEFVYRGREEAEWIIDSKLPIQTKIDGRKIQLVWTEVLSGQFELKYGETSKTIVVESLF